MGSKLIVDMQIVEYTKKSAFSLLELSIVLVIVSVIMGFGITAYNSQLNNVETIAIENQLKTIQAALDSFFKINGRYPCPAAGNLTPSSASYGVEATTCSPTSCPSEMICGTNSVRGAIPFKTLGLEAFYIRDSWGTKISYAIDNLFTIANGNCETGGNLTIQDYGNNIVSDKAVYALISHGETKLGGYDAQTGALNACSATAKDAENCDADDIFRVSELMYKDPSAATYYDDIVVWGNNPNYKTCPVGLKECRMWFDSSDRCSMTTSGSNVSEWRSKGKYKYRAKQSSDAIRPNLTTSSASLLNGRQYITFTSGDLLIMDNNTSGDEIIENVENNAYTQVIVYRTAVSSAMIFTFADTTSFSTCCGDRAFIIEDVGLLTHYNWQSAVEYVTGERNYSDNIAHIGVASLNASNVHRLWVDGALVATGTHTYSDNYWDYAVIIGGHQWPGYYAGDIMEILYFDYLLSDDERKILEVHLANKWGVSF